MKFRAKVTKCAPKGSSWDCAGTGSILTDTYGSEKKMVKFGIPAQGHYKLEVFANPYETYNGFAATLLVANGKIISRETY